MRALRVGSQKRVQVPKESFKNRVPNLCFAVPRVGKYPPNQIILHTALLPAQKEKH